MLRWCDGLRWNTSISEPIQQWACGIVDVDEDAVVVGYGHAGLDIDVVAVAYQLRLGEAADIDERLVLTVDDALQVGPRGEGLVGLECTR
jgi:hypothetical protein